MAQRTEDMKTIVGTLEQIDYLNRCISYMNPRYAISQDLIDDRLKRARTSLSLLEKIK